MIIYISSPYSQGDVSENIRRACFAGDELFKKGHIPIIPHLMHLWHLISPHPREDWMEIDITLLSMCDALLRLDGESEGADLEIAIAKENFMLIFYSIKDVPDAVL